LDNADKLAIDFFRAFVDFRQETQPQFVQLSRCTGVRLELWQFDENKFQLVYPLFHVMDVYDFVMILLFWFIRFLQ
jgi:hypothetical protein